MHNGREADVTPSNDADDGRRSDNPAVKLVDQLLREAIAQRASDLHLQPTPTSLRVQIRVDGRLRALDPVPAPLRDGVIARLKILAKLDISEKRLPQDGGLTIKRPDGGLQRATMCTLPVAHGERLVLAFERRQPRRLAIDALGFPQDVLRQVVRAASGTSGLTLITGPPRSGVSTTLSSLVAHLDNGSRDIVMVTADPCEASDNVTLVTPKPSIGLDTAAAVRSICRQDPDIVVVESIADHETADAVLYGLSNGMALVASMIAEHPAEALRRLLDLGWDPVFIASSVRCVVGQRLVGVICDSCKSEDDHAGIDEAGATATPFRGMGCEVCGHTGYRGRTPVVETLSITDAVRAALHQRASADDIRLAARRAAPRTFALHALELVRAARTTADEYMRIRLETEPMSDR